MYQDSYITEITKGFGLKHANPVKTPNEDYCLHVFPDIEPHPTAYDICEDSMTEKRFCDSDYWIYLSNLRVDKKIIFVVNQYTP